MKHSYGHRNPCKDNKEAQKSGYLQQKFEKNRRNSLSDLMRRLVKMGRFVSKTKSICLGTCKIEKKVLT
jgi:hypothetical protein